MPHFTLEYSGNLPIKSQDLLLKINLALVDTHHFEEIDIKSRAIRLDDVLIGTQPADRAFLHAKLAILKGRSAEVRRELSERVLAVIQAAQTWPAGLDVQLCVEVLEIDRETYAKAHLSH
ncbi:5-carboxymethyl-2-hydroxymuconate Delta-isomerase [Undibacterium sp. Di27W]|uniref:5-carboxymethyl-2-hydroxymuconate Delta-isomerase n=1 Tax=Undibacterium sp. Di27W TaxID=3413036 RepID=UPI003BEFDE3B